MELVPQRDRALQDELHKQNYNDELRKKFANKANEVGAYTKAKMEVTDPLDPGVFWGFARLCNMQQKCTYPMSVSFRCPAGNRFKGYRDARHSRETAGRPEGLPGEHRIVHT